MASHNTYWDPNSGQPESEKMFPRFEKFAEILNTGAKGLPLAEPLPTIMGSPSMYLVNRCPHKDGGLSCQCTFLLQPALANHVICVASTTFALDTHVI